MKTITSVSGGKSSAYMALHFPTDYYLFALVLNESPDTAPKDKGLLKEVQERVPGFIGTAEVELTLLNLLKLEQRLGKPITWVTAKQGQSTAKWIDDPETGWLPNHLTFDRTIKCKVGLPDKTKRWCTQELKVQAIWWHIHNYILTDINDMVWMNIGYRADESHRWLKLQRCQANTIEYPVTCPVGGRDARVKHNWRRHEYRVPSCPMIEAGVTQLDVLRYWSEQSWVWPAVSNCAHCFFHNNRQLSETYERYPAHIEWAIQKEKQRGARWDSEQTLKQRLEAKQDELFETREFSCVCTD